MTLPPLPASLIEAIDAYWCAAHAEGAAGATHDTEYCRAQRAYDSLIAAACAYAEQAMSAERDRCAQIADAHASRHYNWGSENSDIYHAQAHWASCIAAAIRALKDKT